MEEVVCDQDHTVQEDRYHFALSGKAFDVITEHFPHLIQKVRTHNWSYKHSIGDCTSVVPL